jgi:hypothetical protein
MTTLDRRSFLATATTAAIAAGVACGGNSGGSPPASGGADSPAPGGVDPTAVPPFNLNRASARVFFPKSGGHKLTAWYLKGGNPTGTEIKSSLAVSGLKAGALTLRDASSGNVEHPSDSLSMLAEDADLGLTGPFTIDLSDGITVNVNVGDMFAGRPYSGDRLLMRTGVYKDQSEAMTGPSPASGKLYALTDNFNWLTAIDSSSKFKLTIDGVDIEPEVAPASSLRPVCITHDASVAHKPAHVLIHNRHFAKMIGASETVNLRLPVCLTGQGGQTFAGAQLNSGDPICNGRIIWE